MHEIFFHVSPLIGTRVGREPLVDFSKAFPIIATSAGGGSCLKVCHCTFVFWSQVQPTLTAGGSSTNLPPLWHFASGQSPNS